MSTEALGYRRLSPSVWICDVNGVLLDSVELMREAFASTAAYCGFRCNERDYQQVKGLSLPRAYRQLQGAADVSTSCRFHLRFMLDGIRRVKAYPEVAEVLSAARAAGVRIGATTSCGEFAEAGLVQTGLYSLMDGVVTQEEVKRPKPNPEAVLRLVNLIAPGLSGVPNRVLLIGDTVEDVRAGRSAAAWTVGVTYGAASELEIRAAKPDDVIHSFGGMRRFIKPRHMSVGHGLKNARDQMTMPVLVGNECEAAKQGH